MHACCGSTIADTWFIFRLQLTANRNYRFASQHLCIFLQKHAQANTVVNNFSCFSKCSSTLFGLFVVCCYSKFTKVQSVSQRSARSVRTSSILLESWLCKLLFSVQFFVRSFVRLLALLLLLACFVLEIHCSSWFSFCAARSHCSIYFERAFVRNEEWNSMRGA